MLFLATTLGEVQFGQFPDHPDQKAQTHTHKRLSGKFKASRDSGGAAPSLGRLSEPQVQSAEVARGSAAVAWEGGPGRTGGHQARGSRGRHSGAGVLKQGDEGWGWRGSPPGRAGGGLQGELWLSRDGP